MVVLFIAVAATRAVRSCSSCCLMLTGRVEVMVALLCVTTSGCVVTEALCPCCWTGEIRFLDAFGFMSSTIEVGAIS